MIFTVLKSPHVNKSAQEQFEHRIYKRRITIYSHDFLKCIYVIKKIKQNIFSMVNIVATLITLFPVKELNHAFVKLNPDNFILKLKKRKLNKKTEKYLNILDAYGELLFRNNF